MSTSKKQIHVQTFNPTWLLFPVVSSEESILIKVFFYISGITLVHNLKLEAVAESFTQISLVYLQSPPSKLLHPSLPAQRQSVAPAVLSLFARRLRRTSGTFSACAIEVAFKLVTDDLSAAEFQSRECQTGAADVSSWIVFTDKYTNPAN